MAITVLVGPVVVVSPLLIGAYKMIWFFDKFRTTLSYLEKTTTMIWE